MGRLEPRATWLATKITGSFSQGLAGTLASRLWFTPWPVPLGERAAAKQAKWLETTEPTTFRVGGHALRGFTSGRGPTVLLVHGWGESAASLGAFVEPLVSAGYRVVGFDLPGHGDVPRRTDIFEISRTIRAIADRLDGVDAVIAHSMGGYSTMVALTEGLEVNAAVLVAPASDVGHVMKKFRTMLALPTRAIDGLRDDIARRFGADVWDRLNVREHARRFTADALIVHDRDDAQIDVTESEALAAAWPGARLMTTSGLGHDRATRDAMVIDRIARFLDETTAPAELVGAAN
jgi:pimeloyl-ACP methyl ester carboxylesterase